MNITEFAGALCVRLHPLEWTAPVPRQQPCDPCRELAAAITTEPATLEGI